MTGKPSRISKPSAKQVLIDSQKKEVSSTKAAKAVVAKAKQQPLAFKLSSAAAGRHLIGGNPFAPPPVTKAVVSPAVDDVVMRKLMEKQARKATAAKKEAETEAGDARTSGLN